MSLNRLITSFHLFRSKFEEVELENQKIEAIRDFLQILGILIRFSKIDFLVLTNQYRITLALYHQTKRQHQTQ